MPVRQFLDGSYELKYTYDLTETEDFSPLFYSIKLERLMSDEEATDNFDQAVATLKATNSAIGQAVERIDGVVRIGDQSYYAVRTQDGRPIGVFLVLRSGDRMYTLIMAGLYSSDNSLITDLILPKLDELSAFRLPEYE